MLDKRTFHVYVEFEAKFGELWAPRKTQKSHCVTEQVLAVQVDILSNRCCVDTKRDHARQENLSRLCGI